MRGSFHTKNQLDRGSIREVMTTLMVEICYKGTTLDEYYVHHLHHHHHHQWQLGNVTQPTYILLFTTMWVKRAVTRDILF